MTSIRLHSSEDQGPQGENSEEPQTILEEPQTILEENG